MKRRRRWRLSWSDAWCVSYLDIGGKLLSISFKRTTTVSLPFVLTHDACHMLISTHIGDMSHQQFRALPSPRPVGHAQLPSPPGVFSGTYACVCMYMSPVLPLCVCMYGSLCVNGLVVMYADMSATLNSLLRLGFQKVCMETCVCLLCILECELVCPRPLSHPSYIIANIHTPNRNSRPPVSCLRCGSGATQRWTRRTHRSVASVCVGVADYASWGTGCSALPCVCT